MGDILWLDPGDRGTGMQIQYNCDSEPGIILNFFDYFMHRPFAPSWSSCLVLVNEKQQFLCGQLPNIMFLLFYTWL